MKYLWICLLLCAGVIRLAAQPVDSESLPAGPPASLAADRIAEAYDYFWTWEREGEQDAALREQAMRTAREAGELAMQQADTVSLLKALRLLSQKEREREMLDSARAQLLETGFAYGLPLGRLSGVDVSDTVYIEVSEFLGVLEDTARTYDLEQIQALAQADAFRPNPYIVGNTNAVYRLFEAGLDRERDYWLRLKLRGHPERDGTYKFRLGLASDQWAHVDAWLPQPVGGYRMTRIGEKDPPEAKFFPDHRSFFELFVPRDSSMEVFFRLDARGYGSFPYTIRLLEVDEERRLGNVVKNRHVEGLVMGILLIQLFYFFLLFLSTRVRSYLYHVIYILGLSLFWAVSSYFFDWFPTQTHLVAIILPFAAWLTGWGIVRFSEHFLELQQYLPHWKEIPRYYLWIYSGLCLLLIVMAVVNEFNLPGAHTPAYGLLTMLFTAVFMLAIITGAIFMVIWGVAAYKKFRPARFFLAANIFFLLGLVIPILLPFISPMTFSRYVPWISTGIEVGIVIQLSMFALGVGEKRKMLEREKLEAQQALNRQLQRVNAAFGRFVPHEFIHALGRDNVLNVHLGDSVEKEVTVFFSDIRAYTSLSEQMTPKENFNFLNGYLGRVGPVIHEHSGFVNQYYGDGIMAIFPREKEDALQAAIGMRAVLAEYNRERQAKGRQPIEIGIGLHSGPLMMGVIGDRERMDAGVVADTVNTASRMEGLTKYYHTELILSEYILQGIEAPDNYHFRYLGQVQVKGRKQPLGVYECFDGEPEETFRLKQATLSDFDAGVAAYFRKDFDEATQALEAVLKRHPVDQTARLFFEKARRLQQTGVAESWTGIETVTIK